MRLSETARLLSGLTDTLTQLESRNMETIKKESHEVENFLIVNPQLSKRLWFCLAFRAFHSEHLLPELCFEYMVVVYSCQDVNYQGKKAGKVLIKRSGETHA